MRVAASAAEPPVGWLDGSYQAAIAGWAHDPDTPEQSIGVHLYFDGGPGSCQPPCFAVPISANQPRPDVSKHLGQSGNFGFSYPIPEQLKDGDPHTVRAYAIDSSGRGNNPELSGSPKTISVRGTTKIGIYYALWHCVFARPPIYNASEAIAGKVPWGPLGAIHWWDKPREGYYCLSSDDSVLKRHAELLRDAGIDFIFVDSTNHAYIGAGPDNNFAAEMIERPFVRLLEVWSRIQGAPKVVPWVPAPHDGTMVAFLLGELNKRPGMQFIYRGKPLLLLRDEIAVPADPEVVRHLEQSYTLRRMWAATRNDQWSFLEQCEPGFLEAKGERPCNQKPGLWRGRPEQLLISAAYQVKYMSDKRTAVPRFGGRTLMREFETALRYPNIPVLTIMSWNNWNNYRLCVDKNGDPTADRAQCQVEYFPDGSPVFVDGYSDHYSADLEPVDNQHGDYSYRLLKNCIAQHRKGLPCSMKPFAEEPPVGWLDNIFFESVIAGWAHDPDTPEQSIGVHLYFDGVPGSCRAPCFGVPISADRPRPDVSKHLGHDGNYGFIYGIPDRLRDGRPHTVRAYGINTGSGGNPELYGSPKTFTLSAATQRTPTTAP